MPTMKWLAAKVNVATFGAVRHLSNEEVLAATCVAQSAHCGKLSCAARRSLHVKYQKTALSSFYELFLGISHSQAVVLASFQ